ncbi:hypothetical protein [Blautia sp. 1033sp1_1033st1_G9_1033SCRN_220408]|uniref:hypothetical protein n=1 Tax=Blautia sp. 1033sp1_1033st1_G9_1033SCRN_220408 TaxID=3144490 RepID=UPI0034A3F953
MKIIYRTGFIIGTILIAYSVTGCEKITSSSPEDGYNTDVAMSAVEYSIFLTKQISVIENVLTTRMAMAESIAAGTDECSKEIQRTEDAISKVSAAKDEIAVTMPAQSMDTDRQNILDITEDALNVLNTYLDNLKNSDATAAKESSIEMKNCIIALTGEANAYYQ